MFPFDFDEVNRTVCQPHPAFFPDVNQKAELYTRNRWQLRMYLALILSHIPLMVIPGVQMEIHYSFMILTFANFFLFLCFCRTRVWIPYLAHALSSIAFQISLTHLKREYIVCGLLGAFLTPSFILLVTQSLRYCVFSFLGQIILLHTKYRTVFHEILRESDEAEFSNKITNWIILILVLLIVIYFFIHQQFKASKLCLEKECNRSNLFLQTFSHELRNPLNSLLGNIEIALKQALSCDTIELIESAKVSGELLLQLVNNILDSGKDKLEVGLTSASMGDTMLKVWRISKDLIKRKELNGFLKIDKKLPPLLLIDPYRMAQLLLNLLNNAVKFTQKGYIWATLEWIPDERLSEKCFRPLPYDEEGLFEKNENMKMLTRDTNDSEFFSYVNSKNNNLKNLNLNQDSQGSGIIKIIIKDTGCGIKKDDLHKVFDKFTQVHNDPCQRKIGSGLGLYITKEICELMGGEIRVYSKEGQGTTFIACIPSQCSVASLRMPSITEMIRNAAHVRFHGLLIDGSLTNLNALSTFVVQMQGVVLDKAQNCFDAFEKYVHFRKAQEQFQVVLLDVDSPNLDGKAICRKIREYEAIQKLSPAKVILMGEHQQETRIQEFLDQTGGYRANGFLKKPLSFENFAQAIENLAI